MTREQEIAQAKLDAMSHRAFLWIVEDLQEYKGPECDVKYAVHTLKELYLQELKNYKKKGKWKQGEIPL